MKQKRGLIVSFGFLLINILLIGLVSAGNVIFEGVN